MILAVCANPSVDSFWKIPSLAQGTTNRSDNETYWPGGKGIHAGFALNELGSATTILGFWGGQTGTWLQQQCEGKGIAPIGPTVDEWNRLCLTMKSDSDWNETELLGSGPQISPQTAESFEAEYNNFINEEEPDAVMICGSVPRGIDESIYSQMVMQANQQNIPAFVDASGPLLEQTLETEPYSIHINLQEGREISDFSKPVDITKWLADFCTLPAVTAGADGLYLIAENKLLHARHQLDSSKIISTIGAGDCLFAGLCRAALKYEDSARWAKLAVACGSANCIHPSLGMLQKEDVKAVAEKVQLEEITI